MIPLYSVGRAILSTPKTSGILNDIRDRSVDFSRGDFVYKINPITADPFNVAGIVTTVYRGLGVIDVEFPWGNEQCSMDEVVRAALNVETIPPSVDTSSQSWGVQKSRQDDGTLKSVSATVAEQFTTQRNFYLKAQASKLRVHQFNRVEAFDSLLAETKGTNFTGFEVHAAIVHAYDMMPKFGLYWYAPGRNYRPNQVERDSQQYICPRCQTPMVKMHYRKQTKLYGCPKCLFLIDPTDLWSPESEIEQAVVEASVRPNDDMSKIVVEVLDGGFSLPGNIEEDLKNSVDERANEMVQTLRDPDLRNIDTYRSAVKVRDLHQAASHLERYGKQLIGCEVLPDDIWSR